MEVAQAQAQGIYAAETSATIKPQSVKSWAAASGGNPGRDQGIKRLLHGFLNVEREEVGWSRMRGDVCRQAGGIV
jgi:hypothetical protein